VIGMIIEVIGGMGARLRSAGFVVCFHTILFDKTHSLAYSSKLFSWDNAGSSSDRQG
jgi:hypothetical protein